MPTPENRFDWRTALVLFAVLFLGVSDTQLIPPLLSLIAVDFQVSPGHAGILVTSYSLAAAVFALVAGAASDRSGRKRLLQIGLVMFAAASGLLVMAGNLTSAAFYRMLTGFAAGTLSTCALAYAGDHYRYQQRGRAMGVLSSAYFAAFVVGIPAGTIAASRFGWRVVFVALAVSAAFAFVAVTTSLPADARRASPPATQSFAQHFRNADQLAGMAAAFLTSGGLVGFLTYVGVWLRATHQVSIEQIGLVFMTAGLAAVAASPISGWLSDRFGKRPVIVVANLVLVAAFPLLPLLPWGPALVAGVVVLSLAASARQAPLHALTTEIVNAETRGQYVALRNAASQLGIAIAAAASALIYDAFGFAAVSWLAAAMTLFVPAICLWIKEPPRS